MGAGFGKDRTCLENNCIAIGHCQRVCDYIRSIPADDVSLIPVLHDLGLLRLVAHRTAIEMDQHHFPAVIHIRHHPVFHSHLGPGVMRGECGG